MEIGLEHTGASLFRCLQRKMRTRWDFRIQWIIQLLS